MKINLRNFLDLNSYSWWRNHRRIVTLGIFLTLFAGYLRIPFENDFKTKDICGKLNSSYQITGVEAIKKLKLKSINNFDDRTIANYYCERYLGIK